MMNKQKISREDALNGTPIRNPGVKEDWIDAETVQLVYPVLPGNRITAILSRFGKDIKSFVRLKTLELDLLGSYVWKEINGTSSVKEISYIFCNAFQLEPSEAQMAVSTFLRELGKRGIIAIK